MTERNKTLILISVLCFWVSSICAQTTSAISYAESESIFLNPERGFYAYTQNSISSSFINSVKAQNVSVIQRNYIIPQFNNKPLSASFLSMMENDMKTARKGGVKLNPRFSYTDFQDGADAALDTILLHISQIEPILQENYDAIAYMDAGFIGAWGEWYYSTHCLNNTDDRRTVI